MHASAVGGNALVATALAVLTAGCLSAAPPGVDPVEDCGGDRCDSAASRAEILAALDGFEDPVAAYLRSAVTERGTLEGDYRDILAGVGKVLGCGESTEKSFVVLQNVAFIPKIAFTRCSDDAQRASRFFMVAPDIDETGDMNPQQLHFVGWDDAAGVYRRYMTRAGDSGQMRVSVSPTFCLGCHGGPHQLGTWVPMMNEMVEPWSEWNAEPGFTSQLFDEFLSPKTADGPVYREMTAPGLLDSAEDFAPLIEAAMTRVAGARALERLDAADVDRALALIRPLFCDEHVNFVSEIHQSGELAQAALIDGGLPRLFSMLGYGGAWSWVRGDSLRLLPPGPLDETLTLVPVRGRLPMEKSLALVARGALTPAQAVRVRALDVRHPVMSGFRCRLYAEGRERIAQGALDEAIAALPDDATIADLLPIIYDELMVIENATGRVPLTPPDGADLLLIDDTTDPATATQLAEGQISGFAASFEDLGGLLQARVDAAAAPDFRESFHGTRRARICRAISRYVTAPLYPEPLACP